MNERSDLAPKKTFVFLGSDYQIERAANNNRFAGSGNADQTVSP